MTILVRGARFGAMSRRGQSDQEIEYPSFSEKTSFRSCITQASFTLYERRKGKKKRLYEIDEQWLESIAIVQQKKGGDRRQAVDSVHRQQRIFLDALMLLGGYEYRFQEPVLFAAQVVHAQQPYQIRHLAKEHMDTLQPLADALCESLNVLRYDLRSKTVHKNNKRELGSWPRFCTAWQEFERALYTCYEKIVFGELLPTPCSPPVRRRSDNALLPPELFCDSFTQLLPIALDRLLTRPLLSLETLHDLDPIVFIAIPRVAILAGLTWLSHRSKWRRRNRRQTFGWFELDSLVNATQDLEQQQSPKGQVQSLLAVEHALVHGWDQRQKQEERVLYTEICRVADSLWAYPYAGSLTVMVRHLVASVQ